MRFKKSFGVATFIWVGAFALLAGPAGANVRGGWQNFAQSPENTAELAGHEDNSEMQGDHEQEKRDREQEQRDREQEKRDREQEKRDREQERIDRFTAMDDRGREALDEEKYEQARDRFSELAQANGPQTDAALYWP